MAKFLFSPAKINLGLRIVGRNSDQFHLLESIFFPLNFGDKIEISQAKKNIVTTIWDENAPVKSALPTAEQNIVTKLLNLVSGQWEIHITKKIPLGAGLGGGSSNAGTVLKYFVQEKIVTQSDALKIAARLGADVSFFLETKPCWVTGVGENCLPLSLDQSTFSKLAVALVLVPEHCDTKKIFTLYKASEKPFSSTTRCPTNKSEFESYLTSAVNDLQDCVVTSSPLIHDVIETLCSSPNKFYSLSGSGSTCYSLYDSLDDCEIKVKELSKSLRKIGCKTVIATILHDGTQLDYFT